MSVVNGNILGILNWTLYCMYYPTSPTQAECDTRWIFKQFNRFEFTFLSPRRVAFPRLKYLVWPTILPTSGWERRVIFDEATWPEKNGLLIALWLLHISLSSNVSPILFLSVDAYDSVHCPWGGSITRTKEKEKLNKFSKDWACSQIRVCVCHFRTFL